MTGCVQPGMPFPLPKRVRHGQALTLLSSNAQSGITAYFTELPFYVAIHDRERQVVTAKEGLSWR